MSVSAKRTHWLLLAWLLVGAPGAQGQAPTTDTVVAPAVPKETVLSLFGGASPPTPMVSLEDVEPAVRKPDVEAVFRSAIDVNVFTTGPGTDPDGYRLVFGRARHG